MKKWLHVAGVALVVGLPVLSIELIAGIAPSQGGLLYSVNTTSDTVVAGACQNGLAGCSLRGAIQTANSHVGADGILINLPVGSVINLTAQLPDLTESVSISAPVANLITVRRDSGSLFRIFTVTTLGSVTFSGLTISAGFGGITNTNAATVNVINSTLSGNSAVIGVGGGIHNNSAGVVNVTNSRLDGNSADAGGGVYNSSSGTVNVTNSAILNCTAFGSGGGAIKNNGTGTVNVINSTLSSNSSFFGGGGGIQNISGTLNVTNSTLYLNDTQGSEGSEGGGGIANSSGVVRVTSSTLTRNSASTTEGAGGIFNFNGTVTVKSSIIALNTASASPDVDGDFNSIGFNLVGQRNGSTGFTTNPTDQTGTIASPLDPLLSSAGVQNNGGPTPTVALLFGSPAIDKGINALTALDTAINNSTTTMFVVDGSNIPVGVGYIIRIDNEQMVAIGVAGNLLTVTRAANGTSAAAHSQGAILGSAFDQRGAGFPRAVDYPQFSNAAADGACIGATEFGGPLVPLPVTRKTHGAAAFDIDLPATPGIECRTGGPSGDHQLILAFLSPVTVTDASVTNGIGSVSSHTVDGSNVTVNLTGVTNAQTISVTLFGISNGMDTGDFTVPMGVLLGDTTGNGTVNTSDIGQTKAQSGQPVDASNFRTDVTVSGSINTSDIGLVKSRAGTSLP